jgi:ribosomal protein S21
LTFAFDFMSIIVRAQAGDSSDAVIKKFQKRVIMEKVVQEYRDMQFHKKDSEKRQERLAERRRKIRRATRLANSY